jgi:O-antigen ligase
MLFIFPLLGIFVSRRSSLQTNLWLALVILLLGAALYFTLTRSWAYSAVSAATAMAFLLRGHLQKEFLLLLAIGAMAFWYFAASSPTRYTADLSSDDSAAARPILWSAALDIALDNPLFGIGHEEFTTISPSYASMSSGAVRNSESVLGRYNPHNDYLNVWVSYGTAALVLYCVLIILIWRNFLHATRRCFDPLLRGIALGSLGALMAFAVNSFFHNLFTTTLTFWVLAGLSLALTKLASAEEAEQDRKEAIAT